MQILLETDENVWSENLSGALVWTLPESASLGYRRMLEGEADEADLLTKDVDEFCNAIRSIPKHIKYIFVPTWVSAPFEGRLGLRDMDVRRGLSLALMRMNVRLAESFQADSRVVVLDASRWVATQGEKAFSSRLWYMSKTPYSVELFKEAAREIRAAMCALLGLNRKLIVLDLDDTLWGGVVGDIGWENVRLGGHDPIGEAFVDFQVTLMALTRRGILLGIVSKNEESTAMEAIRLHPEMVLRPDNFAGWRINWNDKAQNVEDLAAELNLGLQSVVFIDDNPAERDRVRAALAEVLVPDWPANPMEYKASLLRLRCFDQAQISTEDRRRSEMYVSERKRREISTQSGSVEQWLRSLQIEVSVELVTPANIDRMTQLMNKTNQMNLSTRRMSRDELWDWGNCEGNSILGFRVHDKFGDYGLVGIGSLHLENEKQTGAVIVDFILSCRVMGRKVEELMVHVLSRHAKSQGAKCLRAIYVPTQRNQPCLRFLEGAGLTKEGNAFTWDLADGYLKPEGIGLSLPSSFQAERSSELYQRRSLKDAAL